MEGVGKVWNDASLQYALLAWGTFHFTIYNIMFGKIQDGGYCVKLSGSQTDVEIVAG